MSDVDILLFHVERYYISYEYLKFHFIPVSLKVLVPAQTFYQTKVHFLSTIDLMLCASLFSCWRYYVIPL